MTGKQQQDSRAELDSIKADGAAAMELQASATLRLATFIGGERYRNLPECYPSLEAFLDAEFPGDQLAVLVAGRAEVVAALRAAGLSQARTAARLRISQQRVSQLERGSDGHEPRRRSLTSQTANSRSDQGRLASKTSPAASGDSEPARPAAGGKSTDVSTVVQAEVEGSGQKQRADSASSAQASEPQPAAAQENPAGSPPSGVSPQQPPVLAGAEPAVRDSTRPPAAPGPAPCQRCQDLEAENARLAAENARLREQVADLAAQLDKRPAPAATAELLTAELEFVAADRDRLAARVRELEGENARLRERLPAAQDAPEPAGPAPDPPAPGKAPDSRQERAGGAPEPSGPCGGRDTDRVQVVVAGRRLRIRAPDGTEIEWLCRAHQRELAGRIAGAQILPAPGSENDLREFRYGTCQFRGRAVVAA